MEGRCDLLFPYDITRVFTALTHDGIAGISADRIVDADKERPAYCLCMHERIACN